MKDYNKLKQQKDLNKKIKGNKKRTKLTDFVDRRNEAFTNQKIKSLIDFDEEYSASIRSVAIEKKKKKSKLDYSTFKQKNAQ